MKTVLMIELHHDEMPVSEVIGALGMSMGLVGDALKRTITMGTIQRSGDPTMPFDVTFSMRQYDESLEVRLVAMATTQNPPTSDDPAERDITEPVTEALDPSGAPETTDH